MLLLCPLLLNVAVVAVVLIAPAAPMTDRHADLLLARKSHQITLPAGVRLPFGGPGCLLADRLHRRAFLAGRSVPGGRSCVLSVAGQAGTG